MEIRQHRVIKRKKTKKIKVGKVFGKIKQVSREFYDQINETAEIEEFNNLKNNLDKHTNLESYIKDPDIGVGVKESSKVKSKKSNL